MNKVIYLSDRKNGVHAYCPEVGERQPDVKIEASLSHDGEHYFLYSAYELKGRGIKFLERCTEETFFKKAKDHRVGWYQYRITQNAFDKLKEQYPISMKCALD